jgi:hypothetical protein
MQAVDHAPDDAQQRIPVVVEPEGDARMMKSMTYNRPGAKQEIMWMTEHRAAPVASPP